MNPNLNEARHEFITNHFTYGEFTCRCGCDCIYSEYGENLLKLATVLELLRGHINRPIRVNSGMRCAEHNHDVGGSQGSRHLVGLAADIDTSRWEYTEVKEAQNWLDDNRVFWINYARHIHLDLRNQVQVSLPRKEA